jgi:excinuclease ABC subunit C
MSLKEKIKHLPTQPGVYLMKDHKGTIIYVGKAKNLKNRVTSYFRGEAPSLKNRALVEDIRDFELIATNNELEALLLERNLIRHHQPRYNILLRDDKEYPYIRVHFDDPWPRLKKVRRRKDDGAFYLGPFANAGLLNTMLKTISRIFPLIRCSPHEFKAAKRPCNYYHMNMCLGPCTLPVNRDEYVQMIRNAVAILEGKNQAVRKQLKSQMEQAASEERFEEAAHLRDQLLALERIGERQIAVVQNCEDADAFGVHEDDDLVTIGVTLVRQYNIIGNENFTVGSAIDGMEDALGSFLLQYYQRRSPPPKIILPFTIDHRDQIQDILSQESATPIRIVSGRQGDLRDLVNHATQNARLHHEQTIQLNQRQKAELDMLQKLLKLEHFPRRIECIDISNTQETAIVAANVCFIDGKPAKDHYRRYHIKNTAGKPDDFASIEEVVRRRIERGIKEDHLPDLLVIDGGKGQLGAAQTAIREFPQLNLPCVSLAKSRLQAEETPGTPQIQRSQERIFVPGQDTPIPLAEGSPTYRLMTRIRDEAHRFAITFHRQKRQALSHGSILDQVSGVGPVLKKRLLTTFGGLEGLKSASLDQLQAVKGVHEKLALSLYATLQEDNEAPSSAETSESGEESTSDSH